MHFAVKFTAGDLAGRSFPLNGGAFIGRSRHCTISLPRGGDGALSGDVSGKHVYIKDSDGVVSLVNLSEHSSTSVDGNDVPVRHQVMIPPGSRVKLGRNTEFTLVQAEARIPGRTSPDQDASADATNAGATGTLATVFGRTGFPGEGDATMATAYGARRAEAATSTGVGWAASAKGGGDDGETVDPDGPHTQVMGTVLVPAEEVDRLMSEWNRKRRIKSIFKVGLVVGVFVAVGAAYHFSRPRPEKTLSWPLGPDGRYDIAEYEVEKPFGKNKMWIVCPGGGTARRLENGDLEVDSRLGARRDVPLRIFFSSTTNESDLAYTDRQKAFASLKERLESEGGWNFLASSPMSFLGRDNGVPYLQVQYIRTDKSEDASTQWFGSLLFVTLGRNAIVLRREIPSAEQWRGAPIVVDEPMLNLAPSVVEEGWSGESGLRRGDAAEMLAEAKGLKERKSSRLWRETEFLLKSVLADPSAPESVRADARSSLVELRRAECTEFMRLYAEWCRLKVIGDEEGAQRIVDEALGIFSSSDDRRNALLRKGRWK